MTNPDLEAVWIEAKAVAARYDPTRRWEDWGLNSREDFWSIAQDTLRIPRGEQTELPDFAAIVPP